MSTQPPDELLSLYARGEMTPEQGVGHILQNMVKMQKAMDEERKQLRAEVEALKREVERLMAFVGMERKYGEKES